MWALDQKTLMGGIHVSPANAHRAILTTFPRHSHNKMVSGQGLPSPWRLKEVASFTGACALATNCGWGSWCPRAAHMNSKVLQ